MGRLGGGKKTGRKESGWKAQAWVGDIIKVDLQKIKWGPVDCIFGIVIGIFRKLL